MHPTSRRVCLALALAALGLSGPALAQRGEGGNAGSGLSPYSVLSGNDRSAGINSGNYRNPRLDPYIRAYPRYGRPVGDRYRPVRHPYYGYRY
ncbi:hypothetical protein [Methylobacterium nodulans]|uniref:Uncharacterized protein n=1 Tax=Methylobacterium nodulans (strain LMG 21967 / CNCM I-2342 / ORS 2060) TaxID=460265 RepID=B8IQ71_METNO|nr:hypothetical protein [Methylobacterium nodulans]ACL58571.1 conserved hypothetical protein [Methylobacterium nodulans ORS 2060]